MLSPKALNIWDDNVPYIRSSPGGWGSFFIFPLELLLPWVVSTWVILLPSPNLLLFVALFCILLMACLGYLHLTKASLRCCNSSFRSSGVVQTVLALWVSVPMTMYLAARLWVTVPLQVLVSVSGLTVPCNCLVYCLPQAWPMYQEKGIAPFSWLPLTVNFIAGSILLIWSRNNCLWACFWSTQVSSTNLNQYLGGRG